MSAPSWGTTRNFAGTKSTIAPQYWPVGSPTAAAFGSGYTTPTASTAAMIAPVHGFGVALWTGIAGIAVLVLVRSMLPN